MDIDLLKHDIIGCAMQIYNSLGYGFLESVYQNALLLELKELGIKAEAERDLEVTYKGHIIGLYRPDIIVEDQLIIELKSVEFVTKKHSAQLVNYLVATNIDNGLLINFGNPEKLIVFHKTRLKKNNS